MTSVMKNPLVVGSGAIALVGIGVYVYQLLFGLGITGMNNSTSWGLYLTCFMFFVGLFAGGLIVASSASIFGIKKYKAVALPAVILSLVCICCAGICVLVDLGGIQRIAFVTEKLVPVMAVLYILGGLAVLIMRIRFIPETFGLIFKYAFEPNAIIGGSLGYALKTAISQGVKRGLFSNEAGMGSTPHAHAMANVKKPHDQGVVAMIGLFIDTFVVLTMTALVVISCLYADNGVLASGAADGVSKANMAQLAFSNCFGKGVGSLFVAVCLLFFAFSTILSWNFFGKVNVEYLFGEKAVKVYSVLALVFIFLGSCLSNDLVWELADMFNQLMVIPNVIALFALSSIVKAAACGSDKNERL